MRSRQVRSPGGRNYERRIGACIVRALLIRLSLPPLLWVLCFSDGPLRHRLLGWRGGDDVRLGGMRGAGGPLRV